ncbi:MAG: ABC transporter ATP-binding protein [Candidatus Bathyarchaeota archaeon]|nr:ABC transporter ATP-binding protein [Candidatus Bathyarchaeota archaeon]
MKKLKDPILETRNLTKKFGGLVAVNNVSAGIERGTCKGLIGPNGAGKTTFFNLICGILKSTSGKVFLKGKDISGLPPHKISKIGISRSYQITNVFTRLSVLENVRIAVQSRGKENHNFYSNVDDLKEYKKRTLEILETVGLKRRAYYLADFLPHGDQRKLEIGMALATEPKLLLLDEPTAGVSIEEVPDVIKIIQKIKQTGEITILLVEHKIDVIMGVCDMVMVMHQGSVIADGTPKEITNNKLVQTVYLGGD